MPALEKDHPLPPETLPPPAPSPAAAPRRQPRQVVTEALLAFVGVTVAVSGLYRLRSVGFVDRNLAVVAAVLFLYVPAMLLWRQRLDLEQYGLRLVPLRRGLLVWLVTAAVVLPLFAVGYYLYMRKLCPHLPRRLVWCPPPLPVTLRWPPQPLLTVISQLIVVALPEEFFFRGFIQGRLREVFSGRTALLGTAALFALGHFLVTFEPAALAVFFPGLLFGLMRAATGSILAGTLFHASCNLLIDVLHRSIG